MKATDTLTRPREEKFTITDEEIALSFSVYFTWGYPDYIRQALNLMVQESPPHAKLDPDRELTWAQLNALLAIADSREMRIRIAQDTRTPTCVLNFLASTGDKLITRLVAENTSAHVATLTRLMRNSSPQVRMAVAEHPSIPESLLLILARDEDADVRFSLAENARTPESVLNVLCGDENPYVAARAERTLQRNATSVVPAQVVTADFVKAAARKRRRIN